MHKKTSHRSPNSTNASIISLLWYLEYLFFNVYSLVIYPICFNYLKSPFIRPMDRLKDSLKYNAFMFLLGTLAVLTIYTYFKLIGASKLIHKKYRNFSLSINNFELLGYPNCYKFARFRINCCTAVFLQRYKLSKYSLRARTENRVLFEREKENTV